MILLTGATGRVAGAASKALSRVGMPFRVLVRDPDKGQFAEGVEVCIGDLKVKQDVRRALDGVTQVLLVTPNGEDQVRMEHDFCKQAVAGNVRHIVKISSMEAAPDAIAAFPKMHYETEQFIKSLGVAWTMVRPNFFMQNLLMSAHAIRNTSAFALPLGEAKTGMVDARDVGAVCAAILKDTTHENKTYAVTGGELLSFADVAATISGVVGRKIRYVDQPPEAFRAFLAQVIPSAWHVDAVCELFASIADGTLEHTTTTVEEILGRRPTSLQQFTSDHLAALS